MTTRSSQDEAAPHLFQINRRSFLKYVGTGATALLGAGQLGSLLGCAPRSAPGAWTDRDGNPLWRSPRYPVPLPSDPPATKPDAERLASFEIVDDLVLPDGFHYEVIARWGDRFGPADQPEKQIAFGYNNDYTGLLEIPGSDGEYWLFVNHEYVSLRPWLAALEEDGVEMPELRLRFDSERPWLSRGVFSIDGWSLEGNRLDLDPEASGPEIPPEIRQAMRELSDAGLAAQGVSILRVKRQGDGTFAVVEDADDHRRITTQTTSNIPLDADGRPPFRFTGPASLILAEPPRGTFCNCSGGTSPWQTFLTCEENYHYQTHEEITPSGEILPAPKWFGADPKRVNGIVDDSYPVPPHLNGMGYAASEPLDGRQYGWVCEVDPRTGVLKKHTALGRFRHENVALRVDAGERLAAYMGDDRRGGHVWKFVSEGTVKEPGDAGNSALLERGTLYVARFNEDFTGEWIAITPETPLRRPEPEHCPTEHVNVPSRYAGGYVAVGDTDRDNPALEVEDWQTIIEGFAEKPFDQCTLGDLVRPEPSEDADVERERRLGILLMDAFAMANAAGGTPTARPEDLEVHPQDRSVYIAFTDATESGDGSPDARIFPDSRSENSRQYGAVFRLVEDDGDPAATRFTWGRFVSSGEVAENGGGFANADNLVFDPAGNLWMVTDISMTALNFPTRRELTDGTSAGGKQFPGVFGNNAMFMIPTQGPQKGIPHLFATGPMECEMCGPTFTDDASTLILSIQHPGEDDAIRQAEHSSETQRHVVHDRQNQPFEQERRVPIGSNFPSGELGKAPRPAVVAIVRDDA